MKKLPVILLLLCLTVTLAACGEGNSRAALGSSAASHSGGDTPSESIGPDVSSSESAYDAEAIKKEADAVWVPFLNSMSTVEEDATIMEVADSMTSFCAGYYEEITGKEKAEYVNMSTLDKVLWWHTYVIPANATTSGDYNTYFSSVNQWNLRVADSAYGMLENDKLTEQADAYRALMEWQYNYFMKYGTMYNFMTGKTLAEENPSFEVPDAIKMKTEQAARAQQEVEELQDELQNEKE